MAIYGSCRFAIFSSLGYHFPFEFEPTFASLISLPTILLQASAVPFLFQDLGLEDDQAHGLPDRLWLVCQLQNFRKMEAYEIDANLSKDKTIVEVYEEIAGKSFREASGVASRKSKAPTKLGIFESAYRSCIFISREVVMLPSLQKAELPSKNNCWPAWHVTLASLYSQTGSLLG